MDILEVTTSRESALQARKKLGIVETWEDLISEIRFAFESDSVNVEHIHEIMSSYKSNPRDWKQFAKFDRHRYTRNLVDSGNGKFNLMILAWGEGHGSSIHDHSDAHCFMKMLSGSLWEVRYGWPEDKESVMKPTGEFQLQKNDVAYINDSVGLHRVENRNHSEPAVSLHLYCPPFESCHMFDQRTGHKSVAKVTFWSRYGERRNNVSSDNNFENN